MTIKTLKLFVVGPHNVSRYKLIRNYIQRVAEEDYPDRGLDVTVVTPEQNPTSDRFNDWIFGQIDTCDLLVVDLTDFNPNVVYEVAFAHSLGVPCAYLRFGTETQDKSADLEKLAIEEEPTEDDQPSDSQEDDIKHYFKFVLIPTVSEKQLTGDRNSDFDRQLGDLFSGKPESGETILSDYYKGVSPVDAEFVRGLAEGYWRNFLKNVLKFDPGREYEATASLADTPTVDYREHNIRILIPDTFERPDADVKRAASGKFGKASVKLSSNSMDRDQYIANAERTDAPFFFDVPTTLLTITQSSKYRKVDTAKYFDMYDRDRLTDRMARRFAASLWQFIRDNRDTVAWPLDQFEIVWLSEAVGTWTADGALMNTDPIERPDGL